MFLLLVILKVPNLVSTCSPEPSSSNFAVPSIEDCFLIDGVTATGPITSLIDFLGGAAATGLLTSFVDFFSFSFVY